MDVELLQLEEQLRLEMQAARAKREERKELWQKKTKFAPWEKNEDGDVLLPTQEGATSPTSSRSSTLRRVPGSFLGSCNWEPDTD
jgi:hypothetical protein